MRSSRFFVPDDSFAWYVRGMTAGCVVAAAVFGGILWHFHRLLSDRLAGAEPAAQELLLDYSHQTLLATGIAALGSTLFLLLLGMYLLHRFVGPIYRLKRELRQILAGKPAQPITFRADDQQRELADLFNELLRRTGLLEDPDPDDPQKKANPVRLGSPADRGA